MYRWPCVNTRVDGALSSQGHKVSLLLCNRYAPQITPPALLHLNHTPLPPHNPPPRRAHARNPALLIPPQPRLPRLAQNLLPHKIHHQPADNTHKRNRIHPMDAEPKHLDPDDHAPEVSGQQADVEEGGGGESEH